MPRTVPAACRVAAVLGAVLVAILSPRAARGGWFADDQGFYRVYQGEHLLGTERVTFEQRSDSSVVVSMIGELLPRPGGIVDTLRKNSVLAVSGRDGALRGYQSHEKVNGELVSRSLSMSDTTYTSYRQTSAGGFGDTYERPPGRIYVVDPQVFALFDALCRDMHSQRFDERTVTLLYIAARDTAVDGRVKRLGKAPFKLGAQTVMAEKFSISDPWSQFFAWVSPSGRMLRLTLPAVGLRVERDPDSLKRGRAIRPVPSGAIGLPEVLVPVSPQVARTPRPDSLPPSAR